MFPQSTSSQKNVPQSTNTNQRAVTQQVNQPPIQNYTLVEALKAKKVIQSSEVAEVMQGIDRGDFTSYSPYVDSPQGIGYSATISAPHMHAFALEYFRDHLKVAKKVLDVGSGSGYLTLAFAKMIEPQQGISYGIEHIPELVQDSLSNISKNHSSYLDSGKVVIKEGDGRIGLPDYAPYDCIHVGAAADEMPQELLNQLAPGGRMVIPVGKQGDGQEYTVIDKDLNGRLTSKVALNVRYIPLCDKEKQYAPRQYR